MRSSDTPGNDRPSDWARETPSDDRLSDDARARIRRAELAEHAGVDDDETHVDEP